ncbi:cytospin-B-like isoform X3 [Tripterygium wilfordii]|uniref:Cytospin-B-like isoform X3 n=1 Tax=Tripterygium wilfordii TaxID=458696 RepID=A0A7J7CD43_TRIWF|nr:meiosis-specific protein ASY3-like [Tripterygium wilfordii]XP_038683413.1 meiosis-specific protein ASY3-like [Tripterygium wilfordii]KAF5732043.1 cytospin-B-like isoform X3 [Tripterygium wilfordii]
MPMEVDVVKNSHDDRMSDCRSLGSCYHPSSQSRKISIGMMVDHTARRRSGVSNKDEVVEEPNAERMKPSEENNSEGRNRTEGMRDAFKRKQIGAPEQPGSPWVSTRSFNEKSPQPETVAHGRSSTSVATKGKQRKLNAAKDAPVNYSVNFFTNQTSMAHSHDGKGKKFNGGTYQSTGERDGGSQRVEEFTFATAHNVTVSDERVVEGNTDKVEIGRTETLRMKLCQILGTVSSPKRQPSQINKVDGNNLKQKQIFDQNGDTFVKRVVDRKSETSGKPKQNSDSIETDSEIADLTIKRPVTCSLTRKTTKVRHLKTKGDPSSVHRQKHQEKNSFSSKRGWSHKIDGVVNGGSSASLKMYQKRSSKIEPRKIYFPNKFHIDEIPRESERPSPLCNTGDGFPAENERETNKIGSQVDIHSRVVPENGVQQEDTGHPISINIPDPQDEFQSPAQTVQMEKGVRSPALAEKMFSVKNICSFQNLRTSKSDFYESNAGVESSDDEEEPNNPPPRKPAPVNEIQHEDIDHPFSINIPDPQDEFLSPTFKIKTPNSSSSPVSRPKTVQEENGAHSLVLAKKMFTAENIQSFQTLRTSKFCHYESDADAESSDDAEETERSPPRKEAPVKGRRIAVESFYESSSEEGDYESSKESPSRDIGDSEWIQEALEVKQEDELARVVKLFGLALENIKRKIQSATRKKSKEILMSVSEEVHQQLQNIELQIQTDVDKLTSLSKSKRKLLEIKLQEQQEELKSKQENFQEAVRQHLLECESTIEGLEANQMELKGIMKKQKASNQKLLLRVGATVESQLSDAQRRITAIHKSARKQMLQLKHVIVECFPEE